MRAILILCLFGGVNVSVTLATTVWQDVVEHPLDWKESPWFGCFNRPDLQDGWSYHLEHGWVWVTGPSEENLWLWDFDLGWLWTARSLHPVFFRADRDSWLWYHVGTRDPRKFQDMQTGAISYVGQTRPAPTTTTFEAATGTSAGSSPVLVALSDGSAVEIPPVPGSVAVTFERDSAPADTGLAGWQFSGAQRSVIVDAAGSYDVEAMRPLVIFPAASAGTLDPATLNVLRIETRVLGDGSTREHRQLLPIGTRPDGSFVVRDFLMPRSLAEARASAAASGQAMTAGELQSGTRETVTRKRIRYIPCTFAGSLNWARKGELIQMLPDPTPPNFRIPLRDLDRAIQEMERKKFAYNVVVLVHGHNEEEKGGIYRYSAQEPWLFSYKRDVWNLLYRAFWDGGHFLDPTQEPWTIDLRDVTRFYEFVYPTYRGIFNDLDWQLANELERELAPQIASGVPFNLVIVAHSMGGLVARAALQRISGQLEENFKKLITWGTPHLGSPLVSLRYVLAADEPYDFNFDDATARAILGASGLWGWTGHHSAVLKQLIRELATYAQMDSPGTRDLRYVRRPAQEGSFRLGLERLFKLSTAQQANETMLQRYDLQNGSMIYNFNLTHLNQGDRLAFSDKFLPMYGRTSKRVELVPTESFPWFTVSNYDIETAWGATIMPALVADPGETVPYAANPLYALGSAGESDGAVNLPSMVAHGVAKWAGRISGDHEEYFGAPNAAGGYANETFGMNNAHFTINRMYGGEDNPNRAYDRLGIHRAPYVEPYFNMAYDTAWDGYKKTWDIGFADEVSVVIGVKAINEIEPLANQPHQYVKAYRLVATPYGHPDERREYELQDIRAVDFEPAPIIGSSITFGGDFDEDYVLGTLPIEDEALLNQWLYPELEMLDGSRLMSPVAFKLLRRPTAGTWRMRLLLSNQQSGLLAFYNYNEQLPLDFDAAGLAEKPIEEESVSGGFDGNGNGTLETKRVSGNLRARIRNNHFEFHAQFTQTRSKEVRDIIRINNVNTFQTVHESVTLVAEFSFQTYLHSWPWPNEFGFYADPQYQEKRADWSANYRKVRSLDGVVVEQTEQSHAGELLTNIALTQPQ